MEQAVGALRTYIQVCAPERTACPPLPPSTILPSMCIAMAPDVRGL
jgi:hypothetical protein